MKPQIAMPMLISEIFYSLQGEGKRAGEPSIFIRLTGCSAKHACYASGIRCDTEFESGKEMTSEEILSWITLNANGCKWIVWTGGEPADQLTDEVVKFFNQQGFKQAIETSGIKPVPKGLSWVTLSPKVAEHVLEKNFPQYKNGVARDVILPPLELRYVRHTGQLAVPEPSLVATYYFLSPHFDGLNPNDENIKHCIRLCLENPKWQLSIQSHKLYQIL
jgi:7-carboxy-7-deazaguanine synthase